MEIVLGRVGHYFDASNGSCRTALIVQTFPGPSTPDDPEPNLGEGGLVNVAAWNHDGTPFSRTSVPVDPNPSTEATANSFHLTRECPWSR